MEKSLKTLYKIAKNSGWSIDTDSSEVTLRQYSPAGQDFSVCLSLPKDKEKDKAQKLIEELETEIDNFDVCEETYIWLDNTGHGQNGAPYDMKDVYADMEDCLDMMKELLDNWKNPNRTSNADKSVSGYSMYLTVRIDCEADKDFSDLDAEEMVSNLECKITSNTPGVTITDTEICGRNLD